MIRLRRATAEERAHARAELGLLGDVLKQGFVIVTSGYGVLCAALLGMGVIR